MLVYTIPPKKMLTLNLLDILRTYTDSEHRLAQKEIAQILEQDYQMKVDRKTIRRNLMDLVDCGYDIEYSEVERTNKEGEPDTMTSDWFIHREFEDSEVRLLIDSILFSNHIPSKQRKQLIEKLKRLSNKYFNSRVKHVSSLPEAKTVNKQLFYNIELIDEAINESKQVCFSYGHFGVDGILHPRLKEDGSIKRYTVDPYQLVATNGRYYLIAHNELFDTLSHFRIDRILDIEVLDVKATPLKTLHHYENGLDLPKHMAEHLYMFTGEGQRVRLKVNKDKLNEVYDWFGEGLAFANETEDEVEVLVTANENAMLFWALQFSDLVEILEPAALRERLFEAGNAIATKYR
jgi:predicted DNA-binding transcriptional regulator YafY